MFHTPSQADDIRDFEIEGMSIGDSLLDYFSEKEIKSRKKWFYPKSKKYYRINILNKFEEYDHVTFHIKEDDKKYIIESIKGVKYFLNNYNECLKFKKGVVQEVSSFLQKNEDSVCRTGSNRNKTLLGCRMPILVKFGSTNWCFSPR